MIIEANLIVSTRVHIRDENIEDDETPMSIMEGLLYEGLSQYAKDFDTDFLDNTPIIQITYVSGEENL